MRKVGVLGVFILFVLLFSLPAFSLGDWEQYQANEKSDGFVLNNPSNWDGDVVTSATLTGGSQQEMLVFDLNGDGPKEIITRNGNFINIFDSNFILQASKNIGAAGGIPSILSTGPINPTITVIGGNTFWTLEYDGATLNDVSASNAVVKACDKWSGLKCNEDADSCYALCELDDHVSLWTFDIAAGTQSESWSIGATNDSDLISYWSFDNGDATDDFASNNGIVVGAAFNATAGINGKGAFKFSGSVPTKNNITIADHASIQDMWVGGGSIELWYKTGNHIQNFAAIADKSTPGTGAAGWALFTSNQTAAGWQPYFFKRGTPQGAWNTLERVPLNSYTHITMTFNRDSNSNDPVFYFNGVAQTTVEQSTPSGTYNSDVGFPLVIGHTAFGGSSLNGTIDELKLYSTNLSEQEVAVRYNNGYALGVNKAMQISDTAIPAVNSIHADSTRQIVYICDYDQDDSYGVCVSDVSDGQLDADFNGAATSPNGVIDDLELKTGASFITNPTLYETLISGGRKVAVGYVRSEACSGPTRDVPYLRSFTDDGTNLFTKSGACGSGICCASPAGVSAVLTQPVLARANFVNYLCTLKDGDSSFGVSSSPRIVCVNGETGAIVSDITVTGANINSETAYSAASFAESLRGSGQDHTYSVIGPYVIRVNDTLNGFEINKTLTGKLSTQYVSVADVNNDGNTDILATSTAASQIYEAVSTNNPPEVINTFAGGGFAGIPSGPVCKGDTQLFSAFDCATYPSGDCNYNNDVVGDQELLFTDCGYIGGDTSGNLSVNNPSVSCLYNTTGTFQVTIYVEDQANLGNHTALPENYNTDPITINVIDGIPGQTCGFVSTTSPSQAGEIAVATPSQEATDEAIESFFSALFGTSTKLKFIIAIAMIIGIIVAAAQITSNAVVIIMVGLLGTILVTFLGLLSPWILIIIMIFMVMILMFKNFIVPSGGGG